MFRSDDRVCGSKPRIQAIDSTRAAPPKRCRAARVPRPANVPALPSRSTILAVVVELAHELVKRHHRAAWGWRAVADPGGLQPPFTDASLLEWRDARSGRADLRHRPVAVGDDDRLARRGQADLVGWPVPQ